MHTPASSTKSPPWLHTTLLHQKSLRPRTAISQLLGYLTQIRRIQILQGRVVHTQQELISALQWRAVNSSVAELSAYGELVGLHSSAHLGPSCTWLPPSSGAIANPLMVLAEAAEIYRFTETVFRVDSAVPHTNTLV